MVVEFQLAGLLEHILENNVGSHVQVHKVGNSEHVLFQNESHQCLLVFLCPLSGQKSLVLESQEAHTQLFWKHEYVCLSTVTSSCFFHS